MDATSAFGNYRGRVRRKVLETDYFSHFLNKSFFENCWVEGEEVNRASDEWDNMKRRGVNRVSNGLAKAPPCGSILNRHGMHTIQIPMLALTGPLHKYSLSRRFFLRLFSRGVLFEFLFIFCIHLFRRLLYFIFILFIFSEQYFFWRMPF